MMTIEAAFQKLAATFGVVREELENLSLTVIEDRPASDAELPIERLGDLTVELRGWAEEGLASAVAASREAAHPANLRAASTGLLLANQSFIRLKHRFFDEAAAHHAIDRLRRASRARGGEWLSWSQSVIRALNACRPLLHELDKILLDTWEELVERLANRSVSLQATSIGQQITSPPPSLDAELDRATSVMTAAENLAAAAILRAGDLR
jgi:hypothetical protein